VRFISNLKDLPSFDQGSIVTMGDFDGIHLGHRALIANTIDTAKNLGLPSVLITYEPSPKKILKKLEHDQRLSTYDEKIELLAALGLDFVIFYPISEATLKVSARTFLRDFLLKRLNMRRLIMGVDHRFGHNRRGNVIYLKRAAKKYDFEMIVIDEQITDDQRTSSSRIRQALAGGAVEVANRMLGRNYSITGEVIRGEGKGKLLGFATANIGMNLEKLLPKPGVYAGHVMIISDAKTYRAVANLGVKPTMGEFALGLEVHMLDFIGDLYGQRLAFTFEHRLRDEQKFNSLVALTAQIQADVALAREKLS